MLARFVSLLTSSSKNLRRLFIFFHSVVDVTVVEALEISHGGNNKLAPNMAQRPEFSSLKINQINQFFVETIVEKI